MLIDLAGLDSFGVSLPAGEVIDDESDDRFGVRYHSPAWDMQVIANVRQASLRRLSSRPPGEGGRSVVICPGGGFHLLDAQEGAAVADMFDERGISPFVLHYRLVQTGDDAAVDCVAALADDVLWKASVHVVVPLAVEDGRAAVSFVRRYAREFGVAADGIGMVGFSAGATVTIGVAAGGQPMARPDWAACLYPELAEPVDGPMTDAGPPLFVAAACDDEYDAHVDSLRLHQKWLAAGGRSELHLYERGGHGFASERQNLPVDSWLDRLAEWLDHLA